MVRGTWKGGGKNRKNPLQKRNQKELGIPTPDRYQNSREKGEERSTVRDITNQREGVKRKEKAPNAVLNRQLGEDGESEKKWKASVKALNPQHHAKRDSVSISLKGEGSRRSRQGKNEGRRNHPNRDIIVRAPDVGEHSQDGRNRDSRNPEGSPQKEEITTYTHDTDHGGRSEGAAMRQGPREKKGSSPSAKPQRGKRREKSKTQLGKEGTEKQEETVKIEQEGQKKKPEEKKKNRVNTISLDRTGKKEERKYVNRTRNKFRMVRALEKKRRDSRSFGKQKRLIGRKTECQDPPPKIAAGSNRKPGQTI